MFFVFLDPSEVEKYIRANFPGFCIVEAQKALIYSEYETQRDRFRNRLKKEGQRLLCEKLDQFDQTKIETKEEAFLCTWNAFHNLSSFIF